MKTITVELGSSIKYSNGSGTEVECNFIELLEPTGKVSAICCAIESLVQSGIMKMADSDLFKNVGTDAVKKDDDEKMDADSILAVMNSSGVDMDKIVLHFRDLFKVVAMMGGEKPLTIPRMDDMSHKDFKNMMGEYIVNFVMD